MPVLFVTGARARTMPRNWRSAACTSPIASERCKAALDAVDKHLAGEKVKPPKG